MKRSSAPPIAAAAGQPKMRSAAALNSTTFSFSSTVMMPSIADRRMPSGSSAASVKLFIKQPSAVLTPGTLGPECRMSPQVTGKYTEMPAAPRFDADQLEPAPAGSSCDSVWGDNHAEGTDHHTRRAPDH